MKECNQNEGEMKVCSQSEGKSENVVRVRGK